MWAGVEVGGGRNRGMQSKWEGVDGVLCEASSVCGSLVGRVVVRAKRR